MKRPIAFCVGLTLASTTAFGETLCIHGHPVSRPTDLTYAGLPRMPGWARDHMVPICAGGTDTEDNVWYQERFASYRKDAKERRMCEAMCRGEILPETVRQWFRDGKWRE